MTETNQNCLPHYRHSLTYWMNEWINELMELIPFFLLLLRGWKLWKTTETFRRILDHFLPTYKLTLFCSYNGRSVSPQCSTCTLIQWFSHFNVHMIHLGNTVNVQVLIQWVGPWASTFLQAPRDTWCCSHYLYRSQNFTFRHPNLSLLFKKSSESLFSTKTALETINFFKSQL